MKSFVLFQREIAFAKLDNGSFNRNNLEFTAQAVSYIATSRVGYMPEPITAASDRFLSLEVKDKRAELAVIRENANSISHTISKALESMNKEHTER